MLRKRLMQVIQTQKAIKINPTTMKTIKYIVSLVVIMLVITTCSEDQIDGVRIGSINGKAVASGTNAPLENVKIYLGKKTCF